MKNNKFKKITLLGVIFLLIITLIPPKKVFALDENSCMEIEWQRKPLFSQTNLFPGENNLEGWIKVKNITERNQEFGLSGIITSGKKDFLKHFSLSVKNQETGDIVISSRDYNFADLIGQEIYLDILKPQEQKIFLITAEFDPSTGNQWQGAEASFDLSVGCFPPRVQGEVLGEIDQKETDSLGEVLGTLDTLPQTGNSLVWFSFLGLIILQIFRSKN